jgi:dTDP-4-amino-4,6-dideoxygalactose transaminase
MVDEPLAVLGGPPSFSEPLHVGRPNIGDRGRLLARIEGILDRAWFTNRGPVVQEFERVLAERFGVDHVVAVCNATLGLEIVTRAAGVTGEVIVPSFTFVATAHAMQWQGLTPVFADVGSGSHLIDPQSVESLVTPHTSAVIGVHTWGMGCPTGELEAIADRHGLSLFYDAAHAIGCTHEGRPLGGNGRAEVFSFHATKYVNAFEGGAVATNDEVLAARVRNMVNFGFEGADRVTSVGTNAKMSEVSAAMGLTSLESEEAFAAHNRVIWEVYRDALDEVPGVSLVEYPAGERNSHQYVVAEVGDETPLSRDALVAALQAEGCMARRYFYPGVHRMEPYASLSPMASRWLPRTEALAARVLVLPSGTAMSESSASRVGSLMARACVEHVQVAEAAASADLRAQAVGWSDAPVDEGA